MNLINKLLNLLGYEMVQVPVEQEIDETDFIETENDEGWEELQQVAYKIRKIPAADE